jgi:hypothetical protein
MNVMGNDRDAPATKGDLEDLETRLKGEISGVETRLKGEISEVETRLKGEISGVERLKGEMSEAEARLTEKCATCKRNFCMRSTVLRRARNRDLRRRTTPNPA